MPQLPVVQPPHPAGQVGFNRNPTENMSPTEDASTTSTTTIVAVTAGVLALAGVGYYAWSQSVKANPAKKKAPVIRTGHYGYGNKPIKGLRSTKDTPAVEKQVARLAKSEFPGAETLDLVYEHGHWWVKVFPDQEDPSGDDEATYSVVDTSSGLALERV